MKRSEEEKVNVFSSKLFPLTSIKNRNMIKTKEMKKKKKKKKSKIEPQVPWLIHLGQADTLLYIFHNCLGKGGVEETPISGFAPNL